MLIKKRLEHMYWYVFDDIKQQFDENVPPFDEHENWLAVIVQQIAENRRK